MYFFIFFNEVETTEKRPMPERLSVNTCAAVRPENTFPFRPSL